MVAATSANCPKCGAPRRDAPACASCGLLVTKMAAFVQARDEDVPASLRTAWENVEAAWDKPAAHEAVLELTGLNA